MANDKLSTFLKGAQSTLASGVKSVRELPQAVKTQTMTALANVQKTMLQTMSPPPSPSRVETKTATSTSKDSTQVRTTTGAPSAFESATRATSKVTQSDQTDKRPTTTKTPSSFKEAVPEYVDPPQLSREEVKVTTPPPVDPLSKPPSAFESATRAGARISSPTGSGDISLGKSVQLKQPAVTHLSLDQRMNQFNKDVERFNASPGHARAQDLANQHEIKLRVYQIDPELQQYEKRLSYFNELLTAHNRAVSQGRGRQDIADRLHTMKQELTTSGERINKRKEREYAELKEIEKSFKAENALIQVERQRLQNEEVSLKQISTPLPTALPTEVKQSLSLAKTSTPSRSVLDFGQSLIRRGVASASQNLISASLLSGPTKEVGPVVVGAGVKKADTTLQPVAAVTTSGARSVYDFGRPLLGTVGSVAPVAVGAGVKKVGDTLHPIARVIDTSARVASVVGRPVIEPAKSVVSAVKKWGDEEAAKTKAGELERAEKTRAVNEQLATTAVLAGKRFVESPQFRLTSTFGPKVVGKMVGRGTDIIAKPAADAIGVIVPESKESFPTFERHLWEHPEHLGEAALVAGSIVIPAGVVGGTLGRGGVAVGRSALGRGVTGGATNIIRTGGGGGMGTATIAKTGVKDLLRFAPPSGLLIGASQMNQPETPTTPEYEVRKIERPLFPTGLPEGIPTGIPDWVNKWNVPRGIYEGDEIIDIGRPNPSERILPPEFYEERPWIDPHNYPPETDRRFPGEDLWDYLEYSKKIGKLNPDERRRPYYEGPELFPREVYFPPELPVPSDSSLTMHSPELGRAPLKDFTPQSELPMGKGDVVLRMPELIISKDFELPVTEIIVRDPKTGKLRLTQRQVDRKEAIRSYYKKYAPLGYESPKEDSEITDDEITERDLSNSDLPIWMFRRRRRSPMLSVGSVVSGGGSFPGSSSSGTSGDSGGGGWESSGGGMEVVSEPKVINPWTYIGGIPYDPALPSPWRTNLKKGERDSGSPSYLYGAIPAPTPATMPVMSLNIQAAPSNWSGTILDFGLSSRVRPELEVGTRSGALAHSGVGTGTSAGIMTRTITGAEVGTDVATDIASITGTSVREGVGVGDATITRFEDDFSTPNEYPDEFGPRGRPPREESIRRWRRIDWKDSSKKKKKKEDDESEELSHWEIGIAPDPGEMARLIFGSGPVRSIKGSVLDFGDPSLRVSSSVPKRTQKGKPSSKPSYIVPKPPRLNAGYANDLLYGGLGKPLNLTGASPRRIQKRKPPAKETPPPRKAGKLDDLLYGGLGNPFNLSKPIKTQPQPKKKK